MTELEKLKPTKRLLVMDLVSQSGVDVSDWKNGKGGEKKATSNPKYCYNWAFYGKDCIVLNLWFDQIEQRDKDIIMNGNLRSTSESNDTKGKWKTSAKEFESALNIADRKQLLVRVIVNDGARMLGNSKTTKASEVKFRLLDPVPWAVESYESESGAFTLKRGAPILKLIDQFDLAGENDAAVGRQQITTNVFNRKPEVRREVLIRAAGKCEYCGEEGFVTKDGSLYLETHHIIPLNEDGKDEVNNIAAICANDHREAHFGAAAAEIRKKLLKLAAKT